MSLPTGAWKINANGFTGTLHVAGIDAAGNVAGNVHFVNEPANDLGGVAFWDDTSKKLTFIRKINPADASTFQIFTGYFYATNHTTPNGPADLSGSFEAFRGTGGTAHRVLYGWNAHHA
ncbi:MAG TPA: hypothetical protein VKB12_15155 [Pyrinomonadaceae bacterium]|nr:hypothetical protein [Pyrinomonadaceae bacterium]